jgi:hypothetical protein
LLRGAGIGAISDAEEIQRHGTNRYKRAIPGL